MLSQLVVTLLAVSPNLLTSAQVRKDEGVVRSPVIRDNVATWEGDNWDTDKTALINRTGVIEYDLGEVLPIKAALLQADNNDDYILWASVDGANFTPLWRAPPDPLAGMRTRTVATLDAKARYLRLTAEGGDGLFSVGELQVYARPEDLAASSLSRLPAPPPPPKPPPTVDWSWYVLLVLVVGLVLFFTRRMPKPGAAPAPAPAAEAKAPEEEEEEGGAAPEGPGEGEKKG